MNQFVIEYSFDSHNVLDAIKKENGDHEKELEILEKIVNLFAMKINSGFYFGGFSKKKKDKTENKKLKKKQNNMTPGKPPKAKVNYNGNFMILFKTIIFTLIKI